MQGMQSTPLDAITDALVDANQNFFRTVAGLAEAGLDTTTPVLRDVGLDVVSDQVDINLDEGQNPLEVADSAIEHGANAVGAIEDYVEKQVDNVTPGSAADTAEVGNVPNSVRASLKPDRERPATKAINTAVKSVKDTTGRLAGIPGRVAKDLAQRGASGDTEATDSGKTEPSKNTKKAKSDKSTDD